MRYIQNQDFCEVVTDKFEEQGVKRGHIVFVAGHRALPIAEEDPYTQRIKFFTHLFNQHTGEVNPDLYLMDPLSILPVSDSLQEKYMAILKFMYDEKDEPTTDSVN
jgi:hypothetical protein